MNRLIKFASSKSFLKWANPGHFLLISRLYKQHFKEKL